MTIKETPEMMKREKQKQMEKIVIDIWGGEGSQDHLARFFRPMPDALIISERELKAGFLVNLRAEAVWGIKTEFDSRSMN